MGGAFANAGGGAKASSSSADDTYGGTLGILGTTGTQAYLGGSAGTPSNTYIEPPSCAVTEAWDPSWSDLEDELLLAINVIRSAQYDCDTGASGNLVLPALTMSPALRCAARLHSISGDRAGSALSRAIAAGSTATRVDEVATTADPESEPTLEFLVWILEQSLPDCGTLMSPLFDSVGVGFANVGGTGYWTVDLADE